ncbi:hypothetical protein Avbf_07036 [Armadillidium vulgare]|nr:hypothetical protein Avbf_07036 [Armadillidium vulgare]
MHFSQAVSVIQHLIGTVKNVQVLYSESAPLGTDLVLNLSNDGIQLYFDPICQNLKVIEVYNMKAVKLKYCGLYFNSLEVLPTIEQIDSSFGATHPALYDIEKQLMILNFPGLSFSFPIDPKCQPDLSKGLGSLYLPNSPSTVSKMLILLRARFN